MKVNEIQSCFDHLQSNFPVFLPLQPARLLVMVSELALAYWCVILYNM